MVTNQTVDSKTCPTHYFGTVEYQEKGVLAFPEGIPAFENERRFLAIHQDINAPLVFLQSLATPGLCFVTLPVLSACPDYRLGISPEDLDALGLDTSRQPEIGREVLCLAILSLEENCPPTANLLAPIVVNLRTQCGKQVIQPECSYSHRQELPMREAACS